MMADYLRMMKAAGVQQWIHDEMAAVSNMDFRFKSKSGPFEYTSGLAPNMFECAPEHVVSKDHASPGPSPKPQKSKPEHKPKSNPH